jgi:hypothetical protein
MSGKNAACKKQDGAVREIDIFLEWNGKQSYLYFIAGQRL